MKHVGNTLEPPAKPKKAAVRAKRKETAALSLMALPGVLLLFVFNYIPIYGVTIAFKDFNPNLGVFGSSWNGIENFRFFFESLDAVRTIRNTLCYSVTFIILDLVFPVGLALMFYSLQNKKALKVYNTAVILPKFLSSVLIAFIVYIMLNPTYGVINQIIKAFGGSPVQWYLRAGYWPFILTVTHIWQTVGMNSIIFYACLMSLDESLIEAAVLDGANKRQQNRYVLIPHLIPVMIITTILALGGIFGGDFGLFYQTPRNVGTLYPTTDVINTYVYRALQSGDMGRSTAVNLFQSLAGFIMVVATNAAVRKISPEDALF